jgi:hypothetical protein
MSHLPVGAKGALSLTVDHTTLKTRTSLRKAVLIAVSKKFTSRELISEIAPHLGLIMAVLDGG